MFFSEALKEGGKALAKGVADTFAKLVSTTREKLKAEGMEGLLIRAEKDPNEQNKTKLQDELQSEDNYYQLHQLIREFLKKKHNNLASGQQQISHFCQAMIDVAKTIPEQPIQEDIKKLKLNIPHLEEVAEHLIDVVSDENLDWPFIGLGRFYEGQGLYNLAEPWREQCVSLLKQRLGDDHPHVATSFNNLAALYESQGRYSEAEPLYKQALALRQKLLGDDHPDVATSFNNLAMLYDSQGRYSEAEPLYIQALNILEQRLGVDHPHTITVRNNLEYLRQQTLDNPGFWRKAINFFFRK
ncbi:tetratricopeptide repeat protein [Aphanizomenon flos-aquae]|uniref:tetratricopeptide repeat protein n=1 Tax=Aphanizomenon flos-aquae TaxID=1176 RepID=UPI00068EFC2D|nr:tetratricopeptide repeat protein [Aphanizomenon flos-aquae]